MPGVSVTHAQNSKLLMSLSKINSILFLQSGLRAVYSRISLSKRNFIVAPSSGFTADLFVTQLLLRK
jgi:hypothetical protein